MNEVDPRAVNLRFVLKLSSRTATKSSVPKGHHPGKGSRMDQTAAAQAAEAAAMQPTKRKTRVSRVIVHREWGPRSLFQLLPSYAITASNQPGEEGAYLSDQTAF